MKKNKSKNSKILKVMYLICVIIVIIAGLYYENGYTNVNIFVNDMIKKVEDISNTVVTNVKEFVSKNENENNVEKKDEV